MSPRALRFHPASIGTFLQRPKNHEILNVLVFRCNNDIRNRSLFMAEEGRGGIEEKRVG